MHFQTSLIAAFAAGVVAFPKLPTHLLPREDLEERADLVSRADRNAINKAFVDEPNAGFTPNVDFNAADQYVDTRPGSGHEFIAPTKHQIRGPCPGLNAAANHGFISRSGIINYEDTTSGMAAAWNLGLDFSNVLFVFSVLNSGSILDMEWSIGGPMPTTTGGLLGQGLGISNSHNKYEGDSSVSRGDAYLHNGDAHSMVIQSFEKLYAMRNEKDEFNFPILIQHAANNQKYSLHNNPYYFQSAVGAVPPIAHQFVVAFMSNYTQENIQGYLTAEALMTIFSVKKRKDGKLYWVPGHDKIPDNKYRRPSTNMYGIAGSFGDFGRAVGAYPPFAGVGGNMGKTNSYEGVDLGDLTGGVFNAQNLLQGNNLACFFFEASVAANGDAAHRIEEGLGQFFALAKKIMGSTYNKLACPKLVKYQKGLFEKYPGYNKKLPLQPDTPF